MPAIAAAIYSNGYHPFFIGFLNCIGAAALLQSLPPPMKGEPQLTPAQRLLYGPDKKLTPAQRWQKALKKVKAATIFQNLLAEIPTAEDSHAEKRKKSLCDIDLEETEDDAVRREVFVANFNRQSSTPSGSHV